MKGSDDDVRGSVAALGDPAVHAAAGRGDDIHPRSGIEGLAPITAELRAKLAEYEPTEGRCNMITRAVGSTGYARLVELCDAIDAIHAGLERENAELRERLAVLDNERESMHDGWIRLPLDADGVAIRVGDVMEYAGKPTEPLTVSYIELEEKGWWVFAAGMGRRPDKYRHHHAPTVEDVLQEFLDEAEHFHSLEEERDTISEYAKRLTLAGDAE